MSFKKADNESQAALVRLTRSLQRCRKKSFLLGLSSVTLSYCVLLSLPAKRGGLGVLNPVASTNLAFFTSRGARSCLDSSLSNQKMFVQFDHKAKLKGARKIHEKQHKEMVRIKMKEVLAVLRADQKRAVWRSINNNCSLW